MWLITVNRKRKEKPRMVQCTHVTARSSGAQRSVRGCVQGKKYWDCVHERQKAKWKKKKHLRKQNMTAKLETPPILRSCVFWPAKQFYVSWIENFSAFSRRRKASHVRLFVISFGQIVLVTQKLSHAHTIPIWKSFWWLLHKKRSNFRLESFFWSLGHVFVLALHLLTFYGSKTTRAERNFGLLCSASLAMFTVHAQTVNLMLCSLLGRIIVCVCVDDRERGKEWEKRERQTHTSGKPAVFRLRFRLFGVPRRKGVQHGKKVLFT